MCGASTNPDAHVFAYAAAQVKKAIDATQELGGENYVFWGGREGYETLLNTNLKREQDHLAAFLHMAVDYAKSIGFKGQFLIEPKPKEPTKHQYDFDAASGIAFLRDLRPRKAFQVQHRDQPRHPRRPHLPARDRGRRVAEACSARSTPTPATYSSAGTPTSSTPTSTSSPSPCTSILQSRRPRHRRLQLRRQAPPPVHRRRGPLPRPHRRHGRLRPRLRIARRIIADGKFDAFVANRYASFALRLRQGHRKRQGQLQVPRETRPHQARRTHPALRQTGIPREPAQHLPPRPSPEGGVTDPPSEFSCRRGAFTPPFRRPSKERRRAPTAWRHTPVQSTRDEQAQKA